MAECGYRIVVPVRKSQRALGFEHKGAGGQIVTVLVVYFCRTLHLFDVKGDDDAGRYC